MTLVGERTQENLTKVWSRKESLSHPRILLILMGFCNLDNTFFCTLLSHEISEEKII